LAAIWLVLGSVHALTREAKTQRAQAIPQHSSESMLILQEQQRRWQELLAIRRTRQEISTPASWNRESKPRSDSHETIFYRIG
jgi:hypothetical protein